MVGIGATAGTGGGGWADPADVRALATTERPLQYGIGLRLAEPADARAFARRVGPRRGGRTPRTGARSGPS